MVILSSVWIVPFVITFVSIARNRVASGTAKAIWVLIALLVPWLGLILWFTIGRKPAQHADAIPPDGWFRTVKRSVPGPRGRCLVIDPLPLLAGLPAAHAATTKDAVANATAKRSVRPVLPPESAPAASQIAARKPAEAGIRTITGPVYRTLPCFPNLHMEAHEPRSRIARDIQTETGREGAHSYHRTGKLTMTGRRPLARARLVPCSAMSSSTFP